MTSVFDVSDILGKTFLWFQKAVPKPATKNFHTQMGVHLEEVGEMLVTLKTTDALTGVLLAEAIESVKHLSDHLKLNDNVIHIEPIDMLDYVDSLCDQVVTATGNAHMVQADFLGAMTEVNRSNFSKFDDCGEPIFDPNMKVMKGPDYEKADLAPFINQI